MQNGKSCLVGPQAPYPTERGKPPLMTFDVNCSLGIKNACDILIA
jgi:hypothetical protein